MMYRVLYSMSLVMQQESLIAMNPQKEKGHVGVLHVYAT